MSRAVLLPLLALALVRGTPARADAGARAARSYVLEARAAPVAAGDPGEVAVVIRCAPGVHLQRQAPLRVHASASPGLALAKARLGWGDVRETGDAQEIEIPVSFQARDVGAAEVRLRLDFFVCSKEWCVRQERELAVPVIVGGTPAPGAAPGRPQQVGAGASTGG